MHTRNNKIGTHLVNGSLWNILHPIAELFEEAVNEMR